MKLFSETCASQEESKLFLRHVMNNIEAARRWSS